MIDRDDIMGVVEVALGATLDDLDHDAKYLKSPIHPNLIRLIQDLHAGISRRDWHATEVAASALRDRLR